MFTEASPAAEDFRSFELSRWQRVADQYHSSWGSVTSSIGAALLDLVGIESGVRLLDVATGPGYVASLARASGAVALGLDFSTEMVAKANGLFPGVQFQVGDAEALPFAESSFDRVVSNFGLLHVSNPDKAIREARRVLAPGGSFGFTVWASGEAVGFSLLSEAIMEFGQPVCLPDGPNFYQFSDPEYCQEVLQEAGFDECEASVVTMAWRLRSMDDLFPAYSEATVRTGALLAAQDASDLAKIEQRVRETARPFLAANGELFVPMAAIAARGSRPH